MNKKPSVSVIMPFYNTPIQFFKEAIESVLAQEYSNWQLLLIDDGSQNGSTEIAKNYSNNFSDKIHYLEHENHQNRGHSASRNLGIESANGKFLSFLDSDDIWSPNKLEQQVIIMNSEPDAGMVYGKTRYWWSWKNNSADSQQDRIQEHAIKTDRIIYPPELLILFLRGKASIPCINSLLLRREIIEQVGGFEEEFNLLYGDQVFYAKVCLENSVFVSRNCWDQYRQHPESVCAVTKKAGQTHSLHLKYLHWLQSYLDDRGFKDSDVWQTVHSEIWLRTHWKVGRPLKRAQRLIGRLKGTYPRCTVRKPTK